MLRKPSRLSLMQAPVFINYITTYYALIDVARLAKGERILIHLASGGVGQAAIELARMLGAEVFATAGSEEKRDHLRAQGIAHVYDSRSIDFADAILADTRGAGVDVVLNSVPGEGLRRSWQVLAPYGRFVELGKRDIEEGAWLPMERFDENRTFSAVDTDRMMRERPLLFQRVMRDVARLLDEGAVQALPVTAFPAAEVAEAFRTMSRAKHIGKIMVDLGDQRVAAIRRAPRRFRSDRSYVISGAFGGFGLALAGWMADQGVAHLVLIGRKGAASDEARQLVDHLRGRGVNVDVRALDVADAGKVEGMLGEIRSSAPPIAGVFHAAMVLDDGLIESIDPERLERVMRPKALGGWHLHKYTADDPIEHFVLFSSVAQAIGNVGQASYCAANGFLDGLARMRRAQGRPALSVGWGTLSDVGVAARTEGLLGQLEHAGLRAFTVVQALDALGRLMDAGIDEVTFADIDWTRRMVADVPRFSHLASSSSALNARESYRRLLSAMPGDERLSGVEGFLRELVAKVIGLAPDKLPLDRAIDSMGVDSLMAVELSLSFEHATGVSVPTTLLMQGPTISHLAAHVLKEVMSIDALDEEAIANLSEEETDALLASLIASGDIDMASLPA